MASPAGACSDARLWRSARGRGSAGPRTRSGRPRPVEQHELASRGSYQSDVPRRHLQRLTTPFSDPLRAKVTARVAQIDTLLATFVRSPTRSKLLLHRLN